MSSIGEADAAIAWLEAEMRKRDGMDRGWASDVPGGGWTPRRGGGHGFFSIKEDGFPTCGSADSCNYHVGEASYADGPRYDAYGHGYYLDEWGGKLPKYGIPLLKDHWKSPCP